MELTENEVSVLKYSLKYGLLTQSKESEMKIIGNKFYKIMF